jgi:hypothetical protein
MPSIDLFAEDRAHELFASALLRRILGEADVSFALNVRSAVGGHGRALAELRTYQMAVRKNIGGLVRPDLLVVMIDANCNGQVAAKNAIRQEIIADRAGDVVIACPDPHIERWLFADPATFARVVGIDRQPGRRKCERGRYKALLKDAVLSAGHFPTLGGLEFAEDLVKEMDLHRAERNEPSLKTLIEGIRAFGARLTSNRIQ